MSRSCIALAPVHLVAGALALVLGMTTTLPAQDTASSGGKVEFRVSGGYLVATGAQRTQLTDAQVTSAQLSWVVHPRVALNGTFGWARSRDRIAVDAPKLDVFTGDVGGELRSARWSLGGPFSFSAFGGLGVGVRSYNYRSLDLPATYNLAGYGSLGGEIGIGRVGLRLEARDYLTGFKPLAGLGRSETRNDVMITAALRFNLRPAAGGN